MSGNKLFIDTNIALYLLNGDETLSTFLYGKELYISVITELELLGFSNISKEEENIIKEFISNCTIIPINTKIKVETILLRRKYKTKLPDSIIAASSLNLNLPFVSADTEFNKISELTFVFYEQ